MKYTLIVSSLCCLLLTTAEFAKGVVVVPLGSGLQVIKTSEVEVPPPVPEYLRVFLSSTTMNGAMDGLAGADAECQRLADAAGLAGTYKAWLSASYESAASRIQPPPSISLPYRNGANEVAANWADLVDGALSVFIKITESGSELPPFQASVVWTGTDVTGTFAQNGGACFNWTEEASLFTAQAGLVYHSGPQQWTEYAPVQCDSNLRIYCFQVLEALGP